MSNKCTHERAVEPVCVEWIDWDGEKQFEWEYPGPISTQVDIDLHRYKCTQCGEIGYYSGAARSYFEDQVKTNITGLDT